MNIAPTIITTTPSLKIRSSGRLRYSPTNNGKIVRRDGGTTKWWLVIDCDPNIGRYYRELYRMESHGVRTIQRPAWDAHISVIANERPSDETHWRKYEGRLIEFEYLHRPDSNDLYVWLPVFCEEALDMREELGLKRYPYHSLHLTVGNCKETQ